MDLKWSKVKWRLLLQGRKASVFHCRSTVYGRAISRIPLERGESQLSNGTPHAPINWRGVYKNMHQNVYVKTDDTFNNRFLAISSSLLTPRNVGGRGYYTSSGGGTWGSQSDFRGSKCPRSYPCGSAPALTIPPLRRRPTTEMSGDPLTLSYVPLTVNQVWPTWCPRAGNPPGASEVPTKDVTK